MSISQSVGSSPAPLYYVLLRGAPEIFSERRSQLEDRFRHLLNQQYGGEANVCAALHNHVDAGDDEDRWLQSIEFATQLLGAALPPGARFECEVNWDALTGPIDDFSVELLGAPELDDLQRMEAERAYYRYLCKMLGDPIGVLTAHSAMVNAAEVADGSPRPKAYDKAEKEARAIALKGLPVGPEAMFWCSFFEGLYERPGAVAPEAAWPATGAPF
jgi:hypothetical protein